MLQKAIAAREGVCQLPLSLAPEIERVSELFAVHDYKAARELLDTFQSSY